jgi:thiamine biosynthesis lipoprotein
VTIDPRTGWPVAHRRAATAIAGTAMEADALATAMLVLSEDEAHQCVEAIPGAMARVAEPGGARWLSGRVQAEPICWEPFAPQGPVKQQAGHKWTEGWIANVTFEAPPKNMRQERAFRSPYVAIWVSDENNKPVRTLILIGSIKEWQEDNYIWWGLNRGRTKEMLDGRSMSTRGSGTYKVYWDGVDDAGERMPPGKYVIHVETSRERGKHTHRMLPLDLSKPKQFESELPVDADSGSLRVEFRKFG